MYWLGNEGTSYTLLTTTLISSGSGPGKQNNSPAFYPQLRACLFFSNKIMDPALFLYRGYVPIRVWYIFGSPILM